MLHSQRQIYIVGTGSIGKALAVFLKLEGRKVTLVRGSMDDGSSTTEEIWIESEENHYASIPIVTLSTIKTMEGIVVLATKSYGNKQLAVSLKEKTGSSPIVLLQNGLHIEQAFLLQNFPELYRCVLFVTSQSVSSNRFRFKPVSVCPVGIVKGSVGKLYHIVQQLDTRNFGFKSEKNIQQIIWKKVIVNCVFNSVCPLLETDNGIFVRNDEARRIARRIISECLLVAEQEGIILNSKDIEKSLLQISKSSEGQFISTLQDIRNNRKTEIETLNLEIARMAKGLKMVQRCRETNLLGTLIKLKAEIKVEEHSKSIMT
ncbi:2-dehydropantoate 2-reductase [Zunongwangia sp. F363]|uniref:2-dehydropantoate 2-reductase n=1 Tax=Autumnicola tepida TaxID=3075595 RepID=A0ABU3CEM9_9FLAO|nr:2-dehydropantoate 2-reductase [Zunongwangia sp. F363]MDT0644812.1 2-dehydropantoate 2-reductase [Zunongwangia sp. F363]